MTTARRTWTAIAAVTTVLLSACSPYGPSERWKAEAVAVGVPAIEWPLGAPDLRNEWVAALFQANAAFQAARNAHDFSHPALRGYFTDVYLRLGAQTVRNDAANDDYIGDESGYWYAPGPIPSKVLSIDVEGDSATVWTCEASSTYPVDTWLTRSSDPPPAVEEVVARWGDSGVRMWYELERDSAGTIRLADSGTAFPRSKDLPGGCDASGIRPGFFVPAPPYGVKVWGRDFVGPDGTPIPQSNGRMHDGSHVSPYMPALPDSRSPASSPDQAVAQLWRGR